MAGDWVPVRKGLEDELEVRRLCILLSMNVEAVCWNLVRFWMWCDDVTDDGILKGVKLDEMLTFCPRVPDKHGAFFRHLRDVGWLIEFDGGLKVPNYERWLGNNAKRRLREARYKSNKRRVEPKIDKTSVRKADKMSATEEKRREENTIPPFPPNIDTPEMRAAWGEWTQHRREIKKPITPTAAKQQLAKLATVGIERGIQMIRHSIANGYQGLFPPGKSDVAPGKPVESTAERHARIQRENEERRRQYNDGAEPDAVRQKLRNVLPDASRDANTSQTGEVSS